MPRTGRLAPGVLDAVHADVQKAADSLLGSIEAHATRIANVYGVNREAVLLNLWGAIHVRETRMYVGEQKEPPDDENTPDISPESTP